MNEFPCSKRLTEKECLQKNPCDIKNSKSYAWILEANFPVIIVHDFHISIQLNIFMCGFNLELRKTVLNKKIWCAKDSKSFNSFDCHFVTLKEITNSYCVILLFMDINSLKSKHFKNYLKIIKWKSEKRNSNFTIIPLISENIKNRIPGIKSMVDDDLFQFITTEIVARGLLIDPFDNSQSTLMYAVSNVLPLIVSHLYNHHRLTSLDMEDIYQLKESREQEFVPYVMKPMHLWSCSELGDWMYDNKYPKTLIENFENQRINGYTILNATAEDLQQFLEIPNQLLSKKLIYDVYTYLRSQDKLCADWQYTSMKLKHKPNEVLMISHISDRKEVSDFVNNIKLEHKYSFYVTSPSNEILVKDEKWKMQITTAQIIVVFVTNKLLTSNKDSLVTGFEKRIIFSLWLQKPVVFIFSDVDFKRVDEAFKIMIEDQPVLDIQINSPESSGKYLIGLFDLINSNPNIEFRKFDIPTISLYDQLDAKNLVYPENYMKKVVIHFHSECRNKVNILKSILEHHKLFVYLISVDQIEMEFGNYFDNDQNVREEILVSANLVISCISPGYIQKKQTKTDLKLLYQVLHKNLILILLLPLRDQRTLSKFQQLVSQSLTPNFKCKVNKIKDIPKIDMSHINDIHSMMTSNFLTEIKKFY